MKIIKNENNLKIEDIKFWTHDPDTEILLCDSIDEAAFLAVEEKEDGDEDINLKCLKLYGFIPKKINIESLAEAIKENIQDYINENYMGEESVAFGADEFDLIKDFAESFSEKIDVWYCDNVMTIEKNIENIDC